MGLNIKLGDPAQNSYVNATMANEYFANRRNTTEWDNLATPDKVKVLAQAARDMDRFNFIGNKYYDTQGLQFPRDDHLVVTGNCGTPITKTSFRHSNLYSTTYGVYPTSFWKYGSVHITSGTPVNDIRLIASSNVTNGSITVTEPFSATPTTNTEFIVFAPIDKEIRDAQCEQALYILQNSGMEDIYRYRYAGGQRVRMGDTDVTFDRFATVKMPFSPVARKLLSRWIRRSLRVGRA